MEITAEDIENYIDKGVGDNEEYIKEDIELPDEEVEEEELTANAPFFSQTRTLSDDKIQILEQSFMSDFSVEEACHQAGISLSAFMNAYNNNIDFKNRVNSARDYPFRLGKKKIMQAIASKDFNDYEFILKWLKSRQPVWYGEQQMYQEHEEALTEEDNALLKEILIDKGDEKTLAEIKRQEDEEKESEFSKQIDDFLSNTEAPDAISGEADFNL